MTNGEVNCTFDDILSRPTIIGQYFNFLSLYPLHCLLRSASYEKIFELEIAIKSETTFKELRYHLTV